MKWILIGFTHSGKSFLGRHGAQRLGVSFADTDELLRRYLDPQQMRSCRSLYRDLGASAFRNAEQEVLQQPEFQQAHIVATGGGLGLHSTAMQQLRRCGQVVFLDTAWHILRSRIAELPAYVQTWGCLEKEYYRRYPIYQAHADHVLTLDTLDGECIIQRFENLFHEIQYGLK